MDKDLAAAMGQAARRARQARQLTQEQVAEQLGVSSEFYSRIERGLAHPSLETLLRLADVLGVDVDTLFGLDAGPAGTVASFPLTSADDSPTVRRMAAELQAARPSTVRLVRAILGELEELDAERRRARRARGLDESESASGPAGEPGSAEAGKSPESPESDDDE